MQSTTLKAMITDYLFHRFTICRKSAWLDFHNADPLKPKFVEKTPASKADNEMILAAAQQFDVDDCAFIEFTPDNLQKMAEQTKKYMNEGKKGIANATFIVEKIVAVIDLLIVENNHLDLYSFGPIDFEYVIKSERNRFRFNEWTVRRAGYSDVASKLLFFSPDYYLDDSENATDMFGVKELSEWITSSKDIQETGEIVDRLSSALKSTEEPTTEKGDKCGYEERCPWEAMCWKDEPSVSIYDINRIGHPYCENLYRDGVKTFEQFLETKPKLSPAQAIQLFCEMSDVEEVVDDGRIQRFVRNLERSSLRYVPICFLNFEDIHIKIPRYLGQEVSDCIPYKYGLCTLINKGTGSVFDIDQDPDIYYKEYVADLADSDNPLRDLAQLLVADIPENAHVIVWSSFSVRESFYRLIRGFSGGRKYKRFDLRRPPYGISEECEERLTQINNRLFKLVEPFENLWYYNKKMQGTCLKSKVLKALCPEYKKPDGATAMQDDVYQLVEIYRALKNYQYWGLDE